MAAPKPRPAALKLIEGRGNGTDSGGRPVKQAPGFVRLPPQAPELLTGDAREEWDRVVPELQRLELTKPIDAASLTAYCLTWQRLCQAQRQVDVLGLVQETSQGVGVSPFVRIVESASKELRAWAGEFGLTPSAEQKVSGGGGDGGEESNPFAG